MRALLQDIADFVVFLPKISRNLPTGKRDYLKDWDLDLTFGKALPCNAVAIFRG